jgi:hypothetical protein
LPLQQPKDAPRSLYDALKPFHRHTADAVAQGTSFSLYTRNIDRRWIDNSPPGPSSGDVVIAHGYVYESASPTAPAVGVFDLGAMVTSVAGDRERRTMSIEITLNRGDTEFDKAVHAPADGDKAKNYANVTRAETNDINLSGIVEYPAGGKLADAPLSLTVVGGTGAFAGARGECTVYTRAKDGVFEFVLTLF